MEYGYRLRAQRDVGLRSASPVIVGPCLWIRIVRTEGLGVMELVPRNGRAREESIVLPLGDDGWVPIGNREVQVVVRGTSASLTCDIETLEGPLEAMQFPPPPAAPMPEVLMASGVDDGSTGLTGLAILAANAALPVPRFTTALRLEVHAPVVTVGAATLLMFGLQPFDADGNPVYGNTAAGIASPAVNTSPSIRFTTIGPSHEALVVFGSGLPDLTSGGGANAMAFTSRGLPVTARVEVQRFTSGALGGLSATWKLYAVREM